MSRTDTNTDVLIPLDEATDRSVVGGKAAALAVARAAGYLVPDGVIVPVGAVVPDAIAPWDAVAGVVEKLGGSVAVRSSAVDEDSADASYAGQYETVLDVTDDDQLVAAIRHCRASAESAAVHSYAAHAHAEESGIAVLVQRMVQPSAAGVAFSVDPVTGHDQVVIEATAGVGDALLAGEITGERWTVDGTPTLAGDQQDILTAQEAANIAGLCQRLHEALDTNVDIEWAIEDGTLYLLQVRPVTVVPLEPTERPPAEQCFVLEPRFATAVTPLGFSVWLPRHGESFSLVFAKFGVPIERIDNRLYLGRIYSRAVPTMDRGKDGPPPPLPIMKALFRFAPPIRKRMKAAANWRGDDGINALIADWESRLRARTHERTAELRTRDLSAMSDAELADHFEEVGDHLLKVAVDHFDLAIGCVFIATGRLGMFVEEKLGWPMHEVFALLQGYGQATVAHGEAIRDLIDALGADWVDAALADPSTLLTAPAAEQYIEDWGHRVHVDLSQPTEAEHPALIAGHIRRHLASTRTEADPKAAAREAEENALAQLSTDADRARFRSLLDLARRGRPYGDETEGTTLAAIAATRPAAFEAARRFVAAGRLADESDIWFVMEDELLAMLRSPDAPTPDVTRRRREHQWALANPAPDHLGAEPAGMLSPKVSPPKYKDVMGALLWSLGASESEPPAATDGDTLAGIPGSPGVVEGPVRIIRSPSEFHKIEPGDIVVCIITQASWSPIFDVIGGLVTEKGGPLSHPGTLAREYALPCVLSVPDAMKTLNDGDLIRLDGGSGKVTPID